MNFICLGDGLGGADCVDSDGKRVYKAPSELENYFITDPESFQRYTAWCYGTDVKTAKAGIEARMNPAPVQEYDPYTP